MAVEYVILHTLHLTYAPWTCACMMCLYKISIVHSGQLVIRASRHRCLQLYRQPSKYFV